jgi:hypothetical protein
MVIADIIHFHYRSATRNLPEGWWLLPAMLIGSSFWGSVIYAIAT